MCGIFGILASGGSVSPKLLEQATDSLAHRGPDDRGTVIIQSKSTPGLEVGLGCRRLAILDLSPLGHQPMQDPETGNWIVYNGEIYNFRELRTRLQAEGDRFVSQSDTEVLLKAYGRWGEKCLGELRGMFAFRHLGRQALAPVAGARSNGHQAALLRFRGPEFSVRL